MGNELNASVDALERELARVAPDVGAWLSPPAAPADRRALEASLRRELPTDLDRWLARHDGQNPHQFACLERWMLLSCARIAQAHARLCAAKAMPALSQRMPFEPSWVPFASDEAGSYLLVAPDGGVRQIESDAQEADALAPDLAAWLDARVRELRSGALVFDPAQGHLTYRDAFGTGV